MEGYDEMIDDPLNISDVIEVIQTTDPSFAETTDPSFAKTTAVQETIARVDQETVRRSSTRMLSPYLEIVEQPASKSLRFRYECEGRSAGSLPGVNSNPENKSYPSIRIVGYQGRAIVVVSCVTKDRPYRPHPHNLVGKDGCKQGVCTVELSPDNMTVVFSNLGIQCVKKKDIEEALRVREEIRVDPFQTGFAHKKSLTNIDLNAVRLCFQGFIEGSRKGKFNVPLPPVVSVPIFDKKTMAELVICKLSHCSASVAGGMAMILLCEKVVKEDIQVRFYEEKDGEVVWEGLADFHPGHVHKQAAIAFKTPSYHSQQVEQPVQVFIQLRRPSDFATSEPLPFQLLPLGADDPDSLRRKRQKFNNNPNELVLRNVQAEAEKKTPMETSSFGAAAVGTGGTGPFPTYGVGSNTLSSQPQMQSLRSESQSQSQSRTPSPLDYQYNPPPVIQTQQPTLIQSELSPHYQPLHALAMQQPPVETHLQEQYSYVHETLQPQKPLVLTRVTPNYEGGGFLNLDNPSALADVEGADGTSVLDLDSQQFHFDIGLNQLDSAELAAFGTALSENLSSGLSISSPTKLAANKTEHENPTNNNPPANASSESLTTITNNTIEELCILNSMFKSSRGIDD